jgi:tol-pal system protein YbgF
MQPPSRSLAHSAALGLIAALAVAPVHAQRLSLSERVARLEQQQGNAQANIELVNQINALQAQMQNLQGKLEELQHALDETRNRSKEQYLDLDSRLGRLEGRNPAASPAPSAPAPVGQLPDVSLGGPGASPATAAPSGATAAANPAAAAAAASAPPAASAEDPKSAYDQAFNALKDGRYAEAARRFQAFIEQYPNHELTPNAYYWLGESYYVTQNYPISMETFRKLLALYPNSQKAQDALLKIGYCQYELKQWSQAEATFNQVLQKYPNTVVANLAQGRLRALKLEQH